jgi:predicted ATPase/DNA-binding SARP family transcriptional activator
VSYSGDVRVDVLGPLRVTDSTGTDVTPDGSLQRRLLALLVLRRGHVVSVDSAIEALWPVDRPRDPVAALQNHLSRLRRALPDGVIESVGDGYRLDPSELDLDADRLTTALAAEDDRAIDTILDRWQGPAYPELDELDEGVVEAGRLDELRVRAIEVRAARRLADGDVGALVIELVALANQHPLRERPRELLMTALAASGRHAEALRVYDDFRRTLGAELGIEPSPSLAARHAELLTRGNVVAWSPSSRIPVPATSFVGRDPLVAEVIDTVAAHRLVSLVGPGGVGKTRVLVEVGHRLRAADPTRAVVMCEMAPADEETAVDAVATALAIEARPGIGLADRVAALLAEADVVLLLDNCEHVLDAIAAFADRVVSNCPQVSVVTSSRERLRLQGERVVTVPPFDVSVADSPAVELFVARASAVSPGFRPDDAERELITEIARRLDGLPLAIELAAARLHTLDLAEVAAGLDDRVALLSTGFRGSTRHSSLATTISWSVGLLDVDLSRFFADLSIFSAPFTAAAAAAVGGIDSHDAARFLHQLAERSLVMRARDRRFVLLETLRAFGAQQLAAEGREDEIGRRHALHQLAWVEQADRRLIEPDSGVIPEIDEAITELRTAVTWLLDHGEVERAGRLVLSLMYYGFLHLRPDVLALSERVLRADPEDRSPHAAVVWAVASYAVWMSGDMTSSDSYGERAERLAESTGTDVPVIVAVMCGNNRLVEGRLHEAVAWYRRALRSAGTDRSHQLFAWSTEVLALGYAGDPGVVAAADALLAEVGDQPTPHAAYGWYCAGESDLMIDVDRARIRLQRAIELAEATHASFVIGTAGASLASIEARHGDPHVAAADYRRLIAHWQHAGMWPTQWTMMRSIARLLARLGRNRDAAVLLGAVRATESGHRIFGSDEVALTELGQELQRRLGVAQFEAATGEGAALDGAGAAAHALRALAV